ncbi:uncharacterized LabA/DUF88 family protein [Amorphus suaedae]
MTHYLFIDGECLRERLRSISDRYCGGRKLSIQWSQFHIKYDKIYYYDSLPARRPKQSADEYNQEKDEATKLHAQISTVDRFRVNEGDARYRSGRGLEQKKVDVMIAVDMLVHTIRRNMTEATLLSGDGDFAPLLTALSNEGMFVRLLHPPISSNDLRSAADARERITVRMVYELLDDGSREILGYVPCASTGMKRLRPDDILVWKSEKIEIYWRPEFDDYISFFRFQQYNKILGCKDLERLRMVLKDDFDIVVPFLDESKIGD